MSDSLAYDVTVGKLSTAWPGSEGNAEVVSLETCLGVSGGWCRLELGPTAGAIPKVGDAIVVKLNGGDGLKTVFTGWVEATRANPTTWLIRGEDGLSKLAKLDPEGVWEDATADAVLKDLISKAGLSAGTVCAGPKLRVFYAHRGVRGLHQARNLLDRMGAELWVDPEGKVQVATPTTDSADHTFTWGEDIVDFAIEAFEPAIRGLEVFGEGAAEAQGASKGHWLPADTSGLVGRSKLDKSGKVASGSAGQPGLRAIDGALSTASDCGKVAEAFMKRVAARPLAGELTVLGRSSVKPGDKVKVDSLPSDHPTAGVLGKAVLWVREVRHSLSAEAGYVTRVGV